jgi:hypothetical protein
LKKNEKKGKSKKKKKGRITMDYCCNPQWNMCGETVIPPTPFKVFVNVC